jgi:hypothetical protein
MNLYLAELPVIAHTHVYGHRLVPVPFFPRRGQHPAAVPHRGLQVRIDYQSVLQTVVASRARAR